MKCFYNPDQDAVGLCKFCGRGLSHEHLTDLGDALACKDRCEAQATALVAYMKKAMKQSEVMTRFYQRQAKGNLGSVLFFFVTGLLFLFFGSKDQGLSFTLWMGIVFVGYALWVFVRSRRLAALVAALPPDAPPGKP